jgi:hypothetical protein
MIHLVSVSSPGRTVKQAEDQFNGRRWELQRLVHFLNHIAKHFRWAAMSTLTYFDYSRICSNVNKSTGIGREKKNPIVTCGLAQFSNNGELEFLSPVNKKLL